MEGHMLYPRVSLLALAASFGVAATAAANGTTPEMLAKALADAKSTGKPILIVGGNPET